MTIARSRFAFVATALMFTNTWAPFVAPEQIADVPAARSPPAMEPVSPLLAAAPSVATPKPLAEAVAKDLGEQHAEKIMAAAAPRTPDRKPASEPDMPDMPAMPAMEEKTRRTASIPPRPPPLPKERPRQDSRAAYRVQLHALASDAAVRREWRRLRRRHGALLSGLKLTVSPTRADDKTIYRMQLGALSSRARARALCERLRRRKLSCMVIR